MKQIIQHSLIIVFLISFGAQSQETRSYKFNKQSVDQFTITGKIDGRDTGRIIIGYENIDGKTIVDTAIIKNGKFSFKGYINQPTYANMYGHITSNLMDDPNRTFLFLEPGQLEIHLKEGDFRHVETKGSKTQDENVNLQQSYSTFMSAFYNIMDSLDVLSRQIAIYSDSLALKSRYDSLWERRLANIQAIRDAERNFIASNRTSYLSPFLMLRFIGSNGLTVDSATHLFGKLSPEVRQSNLGFEIKQLIYSKKLANVGDVAANFIAKDINNKTISLTEFRGKKFVLLDFWYTGCSPCRAQAPSLKKLYSEYKDRGLEIISLAIPFPSSWRDAITEDGTGAWRHVMSTDIQKTDNNLPIDLSYNVTGYPTLILINKEGVIVHRTSGNAGDSGLDIYRELLSK